METSDQPSSTAVDPDDSIAADATPAGSVRTLAIRPTPTDDEVAAIVAAIEARWPRPVAVVDEHVAPRSPWRFSGRWWSVPLPVRRDRPWR